jgi:hypothetical protein
LGETLTRELTPRLREAGMAPPLLLDPVGVMRVFAIARKRRSLQPLEALVTFPAVELPDGTGRPALLFTDHTDGFQPTPANHALLDQLQAHLADQGRVQTVAVARAGRTRVDVEMSGDPGIVARLTELIDGASLVVAAQGGITDLATARGVPVIALVDADAPQSHALTALRDLARTASPSPSVVLTEGDELEHAFSALAALPDPLHRPR